MTMAKITLADAVLDDGSTVWRQYPDGHTEPADEDDVAAAKDVRSNVITRRVVVVLGVKGMSGRFSQLKKEDLGRLRAKVG